MFPEFSGARMVMTPPAPSETPPASRLAWGRQRQGDRTSLQGTERLGTGVGKETRKPHEMLLSEKQRKAVFRVGIRLI